MSTSGLQLPGDPPVHGGLMLTHLTRTTVELEDLATRESPTDAMLRIGDDAIGVRLVGDLDTIQRLVDDAAQQITILSSRCQSRAPGSGS